MKFKTESGYTGKLVGDRITGLFTLDERSQERLAKANLKRIKEQNKPR